MTKRNLIQSTLLTISCMVGAGILVVKLMGFKFCGLLGWVCAALCSLAMGEIFAINAISNEETETLPEAATDVFGKSIGLRVAVMQLVYMFIAIALVGDTMLSYLVDLLPMQYSGKNAAIMTFVTVAIFTLATRFSRFSDMLASIFTIIKITFFSITSVAGIYTLTRASFFYIKDVPFSPMRGLPEVLAVLGIITGLVILCIEIAGSYYRPWLRAVKITLFTGGTLFLLLANYDLIKLGLANCGTSWHVLQNISIASTRALFAYAGLEYAAANPSAVRDPKINVPRSTRLGIICASVIFIATYLMTVNMLPQDVVPDKPVQTALCKLITKVGWFNALGNPTSIEILTKKIISVVAVLGCLATCLAVQGAATKLLSKLICQLGKVSEDSQKLQISSLLLAAGIVLALWLASWQDPDIIGDLLAFGILHTYFYGVLVGVRRSNNVLLNLLGIMGCIILAIGCNSKAVFIGMMILFATDTILAAKLKYIPN